LTKPISKIYFYHFDPAAYHSMFTKMLILSFCKNLVDGSSSSLGCGYRAM
jgi:hypothetical protein